MFAYSTGHPPVTSGCALIARVLVVSSLFALAGCSSTQTSDARPQAAVATRVAEGPEIEDDGLPAQAAPHIRIRHEPDDPSEPFSRNYGGPNPAARDPAEEPREPDPITRPAPVIPSDLPPAFRRQLAEAIQVQDE